MTKRVAGDGMLQWESNDASGRGTPGRQANAEQIASLKPQSAGIQQKAERLLDDKVSPSNEGATDMPQTLVGCNTKGMQVDRERDTVTSMETAANQVFSGLSKAMVSGKGALLNWQPACVMPFFVPIADESVTALPFIPVEESKDFVSPIAMNDYLDEGSD